MRKPPSGVRTATRVQSCEAAVWPRRCCADAAGAASIVTAASMARRRLRVIRSAAHALPEQGLELRPGGDARRLLAVDDEGRRALDIVLLRAALRVVGDALQVARIGKALVDPALRHGALAEEGGEPGAGDQRPGARAEIHVLQRRLVRLHIGLRAQRPVLLVGIELLGRLEIGSGALAA